MWFLDPQRITRSVLSVFLVLTGWLGMMPCKGQQRSVVRLWNEELLGSITRDFARPPVHARNLFHVSAAMYDAWAAYDPVAEPWLLGRTVGEFNSVFVGAPVPQDLKEAREEAISYAAYRLLRHRFANSPGVATTFARLDEVMDSLGYDVAFTSQDYVSGGAAALGNHIAAQYVAFGLQDGSNEAANFAHQYYLALNPPLKVEEPGNPSMIAPDRWQPISLTVAIDQSGNPVPGTPSFICPEWGLVRPFSMHEDHMVTLERDGHPWNVYFDPGAPAYLETEDTLGLESFYKWNFSLVSIWASHHDAEDGVVWDISPGAMGNNDPSTFPDTPEEYASFYDLFQGGDPGVGRPVNPITGEPYQPQLASRGDYTRVLAEYWADGPQSETPPGHWFSIFHDVMDMPGFERRWKGEGEELDPLEYDAKVHLALGGAMHDAAISAWSIKGYYDYVRPVSALRFMAERGQCSDPGSPRFDPAGIPLVPGFIELVEEGDPLQGEAQEHVGKVKLYTHRGPDHVGDPHTDIAGVGWILAENWWPYQRPTFVTPPFAGYISGHSTYSRTAAEVLTAITGSPYFPGGMIEYVFPQNDYLEFEMGPSEEVRLQWATYQDASDACSLSRIWGGIHPPVDDIPGRRVGMQLAPVAMELADGLFNADRPKVLAFNSSRPLLSKEDVDVEFSLTTVYDRPMDMAIHPQDIMVQDDPFAQALELLSQEWIAADTHVTIVRLRDEEVELRDIHIAVTGGRDTDGTMQLPSLWVRPFVVDTRSPQVLSAEPSYPRITMAEAISGVFSIQVRFDEPCDTSWAPSVTLSGPPGLEQILTPDTEAAGWEDEERYNMVFTVTAVDVEISSVDVHVEGGYDVVGNPMQPRTFPDVFAIDTRPPQVSGIMFSRPVLNIAHVGSAALSVDVTFDEPMDQGGHPRLLFSDGDPVGSALFENTALSMWQDEHTYRFTYDMMNSNEEFIALNVVVDGVEDLAGNTVAEVPFSDVLTIDTKRPLVEAGTPSKPVVADADVGVGGLRVSLAFSEPMDEGVVPLVQAVPQAALMGSLTYVPANGQWLADDVYEAWFTVLDEGVEVDDVGFSVSFARDAAGNTMLTTTLDGVVRVDTRNPSLVDLLASPSLVTDADLGESGLFMDLLFDEPMDQGVLPLLTMEAPGPLSSVLVPEPGNSAWSADDRYRAAFGVYTADEAFAQSILLHVAEARDVAGNAMAPLTVDDVLSVNIIGTGGVGGGEGVEWRLFPNPVPEGGVLFLRTSRPLGRTVMTLADAQGRVLHTRDLVMRTDEVLPLRLSSLAPGTYHVVFDNGHERVSSRIVLLGQ